MGGVVTLDGRRYEAPAVVLTAGTFLRGRIHLGLDTELPAGRAGEAPTVEIAQAIEQLGLTVCRFKTGTPPRVDGRSVDLERMARQGLVERRPADTDGRGLMAVLTDAGQRRLAEAYPHALASVRSNVMDHLAGLDLAEFTRAVSNFATGCCQTRITSYSNWR